MGKASEKFVSGVRAGKALAAGAEAKTEKTAANAGKRHADAWYTKRGLTPPSSHRNIKKAKPSTTVKGKVSGGASAKTYPIAPLGQGSRDLEAKKAAGSKPKPKRRAAPKRKAESNDMAEWAREEQKKLRADKRKRAEASKKPTKKGGKPRRLAAAIKNPKGGVASYKSFMGS